ncbi:hypothetical protein Syun_015332 [Stephania yunnanensis]|uniref:CCHC-type domain-containing protein n=1 Tax=Stephania yunnanensis TaxID=152371 RepID=A0AAP0JL51_9MAGN
MKGKRIIDHGDRGGQRPEHEDHRAINSHAIVPAQSAQLSSGGYAPRPWQRTTQDQGGRDGGQYGHSQDYRASGQKGQGSGHRQNVTCFRCRQKGHYKSECTREPTTTSKFTGAAKEEEVHAVVAPDRDASRQFVEGMLIIFVALCIH